jgi:hypothetical protein
LSNHPDVLAARRDRRAIGAGGLLYAPIGLATHCHTVAVHPYSADRLNYVGTIGAHRFYRFSPAGAPATFRFAYLGGEPVAEPHPRGSVPRAAEPVADPVATQRAYESGLRATQAKPYLPTNSGAVTPVAPRPVYSAELRHCGGDRLYRADKLSGSSEIRPEYQKSSSWIAQPD